MKSRTLYFAGSIPLLFFSLLIHFTHLNCGTPNLEKTLQIFGDKETLNRWVPRMMEQRQKHYVGIEEMLDKSKPFRPAYDKLFHANQQIPFFSKINQDTILERTRGYLIGVVNSDEQNTIQALGNLNPFQLRFNPGLNSFYGGLYYYTSGVFLAGTKLLTKARFPSDPKYYFFHPEEISLLYAAVRSLSAVSVFLTLGLLLFGMFKFMRPKVSFLSALFFLLIPLLIPYSHMAKAHTYSMFLAFLGFLFICKIFQDPSQKNYILGALFLGCSAGTIITNLTMGVVIFLAEWIRNDYDFIKVLRSKNFWLASFLFFGIYFITNFYIFINFSSFQRSVLALKEYTSGYDEYGKINLNNWLPFLKDTFTNQMHWAFLPWILLGGVVTVKRRDPFLLTALFSTIILSLFNLTLTRHAGVNIRIFPFAAILCASGFHYLFEKSGYFLKSASTLFLFITLGLSGAQTLFYFSHYEGESHLLSAGNWINQNIPQGESIGVVGAQFSQSSFPPFHFLDYSLIHFPKPEDIIFIKEKELPHFVVTSIPITDHPILSTTYHVIQKWEKPISFFGIPFSNRWGIQEKTDLFIYKKEEIN